MPGVVKELVIWQGSCGPCVLARLFHLSPALTDTLPCGAQNSSLVLTADTRTREYATEPSGEPETLWGRMKVGDGAACRAAGVEESGGSCGRQDPPAPCRLCLH